MWTKSAFWGIFLFAFCLWSCSRQAAVVYPDRPGKIACFYNNSSWKDIEGHAISVLRSAREETGIEFVLVLLGELPPGVGIEQYTTGLFQYWKVGRETEQRGVLCVLAEKEQALKIEVSYELESMFPDGFLGSFQDTLVHYYQSEHFGDVVGNMIRRMVLRAKGEAIEGAAHVNFSQEQQPYLSGGGGVLQNGFRKEKEKKEKLLRMLSESERRSFSKRSSVEETIQRYRRALQAGYNDPTLGIFTQGSRLMQIEYPKSISFQKEHYQKYASDFTVYLHEDLAAVRFQHPTAIPLYLRRDGEGDWLIDLTKSWAYTIVDSSKKRVYPALKDHPWMFAWPEEKFYRKRSAAPLLLPLGVDLEDLIEGLEKKIAEEPSNPNHYFHLGDILYFECYWINDAIRMVELGLERDPDNVFYRWRAILMRYRAPNYKNVDRHLEEILRVIPRHPDALLVYRGFLKSTGKDRSVRAQEINQLLQKK